VCLFIYCYGHDTSSCEGIWHQIKAWPT